MAKTSRCPLSTLQEADLNHLPPVKKLHFGDWLLYTRILACFAQITIQFQSFWAKQQTLFTTTGFSQNRGFYQSTSSSVALPLQIQSPLCQGTGERLPRQSILPTQLLLQHQLNAKPIGTAQNITITVRYPPDAALCNRLGLSFRAGDG